MVGGFLEAFPPNGFHQGFPLVQMAGGLIEEDAVVGLLLHQQVFAVLFHDGGDHHVGFPVVAHTGFPHRS